MALESSSKTNLTILADIRKGHTEAMKANQEPMTGAMDGADVENAKGTRDVDSIRLLSKPKKRYPADQGPQDSKGKIRNPCNLKPLTELESIVNCRIVKDDGYHIMCNPPTQKSRPTIR